MGIGRKATDQRTPCQKFLATPLLFCDFLLISYVFLNNFIDSFICLSVDNRLIGVVNRIPTGLSYLEVLVPSRCLLMNVQIGYTEA